MRRLGKNLKAHRVSWELHRGPIPVGAVVMHSCDNPACVNPEHLALGSQLDNLADMRAKARGVTTHHVGERNPASKLSGDDVRRLRLLAAEGWPLRRLAREFGLNHKTVAGIVRRLTWRHI